LDTSLKKRFSLLSIAQKTLKPVALISSDPTKLALLSKNIRSAILPITIILKTGMEESKANAVYIALPNSLHYEFAMRAFKLGLHVLCETPLATNVSECAELIENARTKNLKLMVAYRLHFDAGNLEAVKIASASNVHSQTEPKLGEFLDSLTLSLPCP
jgi:predicted dehydrogenase